MTNVPETGRTSRVQIRLVMIQVLVLSMFLTLGGRLWYLQIRNGDEYYHEAKSNHVQRVVQPAVRGSILDARGVPLADNETRLVVSASRTALMKMKDKGKGVMTRLADVLDMSPREVMDKVRLCDSQTPAPCWNGSPYQPIPVTLEATTQQALQLRERPEDFPGITAEPTAVRRYPAPGGARTAQVLGYLSPVTDDEIQKAKDSDSPHLRSDQVGRSGIERTYDRQLRGKAEVTSYEVDNLGRVMGQTKSDPGVAGSTLVTSIDARVQAVAEYELQDAMKVVRNETDNITGRKYEADSGAVVVMEAKTGRIVAMASQPDYDPNTWVGGISGKDYAKLTSKNSNYPLLNRGIQGMAPAGSIFKVVSASAAVRAGYKFDDKYNCSSSYSLGGRSFANFESKGHGPITLGDALKFSCNTVFYALGHKEWQRDGGLSPKKDAHDWFYRTAREFGLGSETGIDLPNEVTGRIPDRKWKQNFWKANKNAWCKQGKRGGTYVEQIAYESCLEGNQLKAYDSINFAIGQGDVLVTPIQMATAYSAISNGGTLYNPTVGKAVISPDGKHIEMIKPQSHGRLPIDAKTIRDLDGGLRSVVEPGGTAAWRFGGWPMDKIPMHAKTGTAQVYGKQTTSWLATYTKDFTIVMTISQGGTGSGASGPAVRNLYNAIYGLTMDGKQDLKKALLLGPEAKLPRIEPDGSIISPEIRPYVPASPEDLEPAVLAGPPAPPAARQD
ncbi:penicillin-binding protein 2 [Streptomyces nojiriensis]|uniref:Penicillin-binding protein 2 n=1 Tax=Streptomyces nojiriensis TaxID=66374 RepID=A0ABQ3SVW7_9ACTN|nr:penicillin-binding protein 2 [Streptomyces nojiriensis]QTI45448.1 Peptidoglycan D,D-transpeptidase MrdA [Streptomyces nojiriensis]GGR95897.1 penicillin-binding protein 2 [Streptomyces nojiriensis]GHI71910.1 penicillin-binding protein 2 [Streptomyces nojiriensis]